MTRVYSLLVATFLLEAAYAHHSFSAEYDGNKPITLKGVVTKVDWTNPHMHFYLDVSTEAGEVEHWKFEGFPPNMLVRQGWKRDVTLKPGDTVTVYAWLARDGSKLAHSRQVTFADGTKRYSGPPGGVGGN
jgi:hypothetical protein